MRLIKLFFRKGTIKIMCIAESVEREKRAKSLFKKSERKKDEKTENITNLRTEFDMQVQESKRTFKYFNAKRSLCDTLKC